MLYIKLFIEREKNTGQSAPECPFKGSIIHLIIHITIKNQNTNSIFAVFTHFVLTTSNHSCI